MADEIPAFDDEDIPADIWQTAEGMAMESDGHPGVWSLKESLARAIYIERERCAILADAYAAENWAMTMDTLRIDPILHRQHAGPITADENARSESLTVDSCVHSSMHHAAKNIAAAIRRGPA